jgi:Asp-tRNA(Asn)/Glu-tRNA(Gln) amidotransferase A subunit family amidase
MFESREKVRIGYYDDDGWFPVSPATKRAVAVAKDSLEQCGHELVPVDMSRIGPALMKCYFDCILADDFENFCNVL